MSGFSTSSETLKRLEGNCGVDFLSLRDKYTSVATETAKQTSTNTATSNIKTSEESFEALKKYTLCNGCGGTGVVKYIYNHMSMEKTCEVCEGDAVIALQKEKVSEIIESMAD